jgi:hypothetical protein
MPYSAEVVRETIQTLADGNRIIRRSTGRVYRDSQGRMRREDDGPNGAASVTISDPIEGKSLVLNPANRTYRETPGMIRDALATAMGLEQLTYWNFASGNGNAGSGTLTLNGAVTLNPGDVQRRPRATATGSDTVEEKLESKLVEGVIATGVRRTTTIAKGAIGNEQPIKIVSEEWTSPDLQVLVLTDLNDPRTGRSTYRLLKVTRVEPDATLFQAPADYTAQPAGGARGRVGRGGQ